PTATAVISRHRPAPAFVARGGPAVKTCPRPGPEAARSPERLFGAWRPTRWREHRGSWPPSPCIRGHERTSYSARLMSARSEEDFWGRGRHQEWRPTPSFYSTSLHKTTPHWKTSLCPCSWSPTWDTIPASRLVYRTGAKEGRRSCESPSPSPVLRGA